MKMNIMGITVPFFLPLPSMVWNKKRKDRNIYNNTKAPFYQYKKNVIFQVYEK